MAENKSTQSLKIRVSELEKQHNRLTTLVVSIMANCEKLKSRLLAKEDNNNNNTQYQSSDTNIQNILNSESSETDSRTEQLLEELKKAQMT